MRPGTFEKKIESVINDNRLKNIIIEYTRITESSKTLTDYIITNKNTTKNNISN